MVMKLNMPSIGVLATIAVLASVGAIYATTYESTYMEDNRNMPPGSALLLSNVKVTHLNEFDEVIGYRHGNNHITATGMSIIMGQVFNDVNATYPDVNNVTGRVGWMEIGTEGDPVTYQNRLRWNNTDIIAPVGGSCIRVASTIDNVTQGNAHKSGTNCDNDAYGPRNKFDCSAQMNVTAVASFDGANCQANGIDEAGIFTASTAECNGGTCGMLFARNTFGSVNLGMLDTLQLEWEFTFTDS